MFRKIDVDLNACLTDGLVSLETRGAQESMGRHPVYEGEKIVITDNELTYLAVVEMHEEKPYARFEPKKWRRVDLRGKARVDFPE